MSNKKPFGPRYKDAVRDLALARGAKNSKLNVLAAILSFCNGTTGQAFPGNEKIMNRAGIRSKGTLDTSLRWLKENGIIFPVAYETGGYGRAVVWGFGLPAWSTPETVRTSLKSGELTDTSNLPKNCNLPPQNSRTTSLKNGEPTESTELKGKNGEPTESTELKGKKDTASRRGGQWPASPALPQTEEEQQLFSHWTNRMPFGEALIMLKEHREKQAVAAE